MHPLRVSPVQLYRDLVLAAQILFLAAMFPIWARAACAADIVGFTGLSVANVIHSTVDVCVAQDHPVLGLKHRTNTAAKLAFQLNSCHRNAFPGEGRARGPPVYV